MRRLLCRLSYTAKCKDEGGRMKAEFADQPRTNRRFLFFHPSSFILHPFILHPFLEARGGVEPRAFPPQLLQVRFRRPTPGTRASVGGEGET